MTLSRRAPLARLFPEDEATRPPAAPHSGLEPEASAGATPAAPVLRWPRFRDCASLVRAGLLAPGECSEALIFEARKANILGRGLHLVVTHPAPEPRPVAVLGFRLDDADGATLERVRVTEDLERRGGAGGLALLKAALRPVLAALFARWDAPLAAAPRDRRGRRVLLALGFSEHEGRLRLTRAAAEAAGLLRTRRARAVRRPPASRPLDRLSRGFAFARALHPRDGGEGAVFGAPAGRRLGRPPRLEPREAAP